MWKRLEHYVTYGRSEIDNNRIENTNRPIALGRKDDLFSGSHDAARHAALIYSVMATAPFYEVEPSEYLKWSPRSPIIPGNASPNSCRNTGKNERNRSGSSCQDGIG